MTTLTFFIPGEAVGKGRPKAAKRFGKGGASYTAIITPDRTVNYESMVKMLAHNALAGKPMLRGPLELSFVVTTSIPAAWTQKRRIANEHIPEYCIKAPDLDNIAKAISDGMNGVAYADDKQIAQFGASRKVYGTTPGCWVRVRELLEERQLDLLPAPRAAAPKPPAPPPPAPAPRPPADYKPTTYTSLAEMQAARAARGQG